jgi:hypothetical protein
VVPTDLVDTPERAFDYWQANIVNAPWFDPAKEAFVILILNTRRRILGHNLKDDPVTRTWCPSPSRSSKAAAGKLQASLHGQPWSWSRLWGALCWPPASGRHAGTMSDLVTMCGT